MRQLQPGTREAISMLMFTILAMAAEAAEDYPPVDVPMELKQIAEHTYYVMGVPGIATDNAGFISNAGFVVTDAGVVVLDALGTPSLAKKFRGLIRTVTDHRVVKVIVSHYHADHIYGLQVFKEEGAEIIAPKGAKNYLESPAAKDRLMERRNSLSPWVNDDTYLVSPDRIIDERYEFAVGDMHFTLDYLGSAHSTGDLTMYVTEDKVLFSGDIIFEGRVPFVVGADTETWLATLSALETEEVQVLIPGHGPAAKRPAEAVARTREYLAHLRDVMGAAVEELNSFPDAYEAADWSAYEKLPAFIPANRLNAYHVYMSMESEALEN